MSAGSTAGPNVCWHGQWMIAQGTMVSLAHTNQLPFPRLSLGQKSDSHKQCYVKHKIFIFLYLYYSPSDIKLNKKSFTFNDCLGP